MEIDYEALRKAVESLPLKNFEETEYRGRMYMVEPISPTKNPPVEWFTSTAYDGADVYIWEGIPEKFKRPVILHEILEADLTLHQGIPIDTAHKIAQDNDRKYAKEKLDDIAYKQYEELRAELGTFFGGE